MSPGEEALREAARLETARAAKRLDQGVLDFGGVA